MQTTAADVLYGVNIITFRLGLFFFYRTFGCNTFDLFRINKNAPTNACQNKEHKELQ